ncbi:hypothetical protein [Nocardioides sp.]|uniref:hypothetical protein n=1 Tax=Nocardioides sp. TaxID=35761 RepID=UPI003782DF83
MTTLHDRLADLADDAPPGGPAPDLWDRGIRFRRRRRVGTAAILATAAVLIAAVAGVDWHRSAPEPLPAGGPVGLPDRVWTPSPWLPSTSRPGRLVAVTTTARGTWTGTEPGVAGVSATTGRYAFVDLPDAVLESGVGDVELSPDGRHLAYWLTGPTTGSPNSDSGPITGVGVYDTTSGELTRHWITTVHGLAPDFLAWADADTIVYSAGQFRGGDDDSLMDQSSSSHGIVTAWDPGGEPQPVLGVEPGADLEAAAYGRILVQDLSADPHRDQLLVDLHEASASRVVSFPRPGGTVGHLHAVALDASGRRLALVLGNRNPNWVHAGPFGAQRKVPTQQRAFGVVTWVAPDSIVTLTRHGWENSALNRVAVTTGRSQRLVLLPGVSGGGWQFATDLLGAPSVEATPPPTPMDPRLTTGLVAGVIVAAAGALVVWRRRARP